MPGMMLIGSIGVCFAASLIFFLRRGSVHRIWIVIVALTALLALTIPAVLDGTGSAFITLGLCSAMGLAMLIFGLALVAYLDRREKSEASEPARQRMMRYPGSFARFVLRQEGTAEEENEPAWGAEADGIAYDPEPFEVDWTQERPASRAALQEIRDDDIVAIDPAEASPMRSETMAMRQASDALSARQIARNDEIAAVRETSAEETAQPEQAALVQAHAIAQVASVAVQAESVADVLPPAAHIDAPEIVQAAGGEAAADAQLIADSQIEPSCAIAPIAEAAPAPLSGPVDVQPVEIEEHVAASDTANSAAVPHYASEAQAHAAFNGEETEATQAPMLPEFATAAAEEAPERPEVGIFMAEPHTEETEKPEPLAVRDVPEFLSAAFVAGDELPGESGFAVDGAIGRDNIAIPITPDEPAAQEPEAYAAVEPEDSAHAGPYGDAEHAQTDVWGSFDSVEKMRDAESVIDAPADIPEPEEAAPISVREEPFAQEAIEEQSSAAAVAKTRNGDEKLLDAAFALAFEKRWGEAADAFLAFREGATDPWVLKQADFERLAALIEAGRLRESIDLIFGILSSGYDLSSEERVQLEGILDQLGRMGDV